MSYCMFENTLTELGQIQLALEDAVDAEMTLKEFVKNASSSLEADAIVDLRNKLEMILDLYEELETDKEVTEIKNQLDAAHAEKRQARAAARRIEIEELHARARFLEELHALRDRLREEKEISRANQ
jgi:hypothetical protein